ncbi:hypothetical protein ACP70R_023508 [Stipagrostis hirtigluma subsp. patula]
MQRIDCSCSFCKLNQCEDNSLKIVSVKFGYVSLMPYGTPETCISGLCSKDGGWDI